LGTKFALETYDKHKKVWVFYEVGPSIIF